MKGQHVHFFKHQHAHSPDEPDYWAFGGEYHKYHPKGGMSFADLRLQEYGSSWIGGQDPVDLQTTRIGDERTPPLPERKSALAALAYTVPEFQTLSLLEGIHLAASGRYFAIVQHELGAPAFLVGSGISPLAVGFPNASVHRCLAWGVGFLLEQGKLS